MSLLMRNIISHIIRPPLWAYIITCSLVLGSMLTYHLITAKSTDSTGDTSFGLVQGSNLPNSSWTPIAFADSSRSHHTDVVYIGNGNNTIRIYKRSSSFSSFSVSQEILLNGINVTSVIPCDYYHTGYNDLVLVINSSSLAVIPNSAGTFSTTPTFLNANTVSHPLISDVTGDLSSDILFVSENTQNLTYLHYDRATKSSISKTLPCRAKFSSIHKALIANSSFILGFSATDSTISFLDVSSSKCVNTKTIQVPQNSRSPIIADFNADGYFDLLVPVFPQSSSPYLCFLFGNSSGIEGNPSCTANSYTSKVVIENLLPYDRFFQAGDISLNGRADIAVPVLREDNTSGMALFLNQACRNCAPPDFLLVYQTAISGLGGFFDIEDSASLGFVTSSGAFWSGLANGGCYLKVSPLNCACIDGCSTSPRYPRPQPLSTMDFDAWMTAEFTDKHGVVHKSIGALQDPSRLGLPFWVFGLADDVHYVQELYVHSKEVKEFRWILPDSRVFTSNGGDYRVYMMYEIHGFYVFFGCIALLCILGFFTLRQARKEDEEDKQEAAEILPLF